MRIVKALLAHGHLGRSPVFGGKSILPRGYAQSPHRLLCTSVSAPHILISTDIEKAMQFDENSVKCVVNSAGKYNIRFTNTYHAQEITKQLKKENINCYLYDGGEVEISANEYKKFVAFIKNQASAQHNDETQNCSPTKSP